jgi:PEP-CTERM motif
VTWNSTAIAVNFANVTFSGEDQLFLDVTGTPAIPEPSSWAMMLVGFAGLGVAGWRAQRKTVAAAA